MKKFSLPETIDLKALDEFKKKNQEERIKFLDQYVEWLKKTPNKIWSKQQKAIINTGVRRADDGSE